MTLGELIADFRDAAKDDSTMPHLWSDHRLTVFANEAEREACRRGDLLIESANAMCSITVLAGDPVVTIDPRILTVKRAKLDLGSLPLEPNTMTAMDNTLPSWESITGRPTQYITDYQTNALRLFPVPSDVTDTLRLTVRRLPLADMADADDEPEIRAESHQALVQWMLYRAFSQTDVDGYDKASADRALAEFTREFGGKASARNEAWQRVGHSLDAEPIA